MRRGEGDRESKLCTQYAMHSEVERVPVGISEMGLLPPSSLPPLSLSLLSFPLSLSISLPPSWSVRAVQEERESAISCKSSSAGRSPRVEWSECGVVARAHA